MEEMAVVSARISPRAFVAGRPGTLGMESVI